MYKKNILPSLSQMIEKVDFISDKIRTIESAISNEAFLDCEDSILELKDLSTGSDWQSLKETVCAFLNTSGGYIICGVRERNKRYAVTGFDRNNEGRIIELRDKVFANDHGVLLDLTENIYFEYREVQGNTVAVIAVRPLSEDLKYLKFQGNYFERVLTQDKIIAASKITQQREYKAELEYSKEIKPVSNARVDDLDLDKINQYIIKINTTGRKETVKKDMADAANFLRRRYCITASDEVSVLGLLLFGKEPYLNLENRARVDCYFETGHQIGKDKKYLESDILNLMDDAFAFVWGHIKVGRSVVNGGRSEPEFPVELIRETVNNALAHRDYTINNFITITVNPGDGIQIKNPGSFKQKMIFTESTEQLEIRRILPGVAESKNPKLANILKSFDKIEGQGIGMATLVSACLDNSIDIPYYDLSVPDTVSLVIPAGKLMDGETEWWMNAYHNYLNNRLNGKLTEEHKLVLAYILKSEKLNQKRFYTILLSPNNNHFDVLSDLKKSGLIWEHNSSNGDQSPIYRLDKELLITDFTHIIENRTGKSMAGMDATYKAVLTIIYKNNHYNLQSIKPNVITPALYAQLYGKSIDPTTHESLGRKVRKICSELVSHGFLTKKEDRSYEINSGHSQPQLPLK
jgi:ATP-dependent DNA helicase RecG